MQARPENDLVYLLIVLESVGKILIYSKEFDSPLQFYEANEQLNFNASLLLLANIGEQTTKVSLETKNKYPLIKWRQVKEMRNRVVHDYTGIDFEITFDIVKSELPVLKSQIEKIIIENLQLGVFDVEEFEVARKSNYYSHVDFEKLQ